MPNTANTSFFIGCILALAGCAAPVVDAPSAAECALPGDIDCASADASKADAWDDANDPRRVSRTLNYRVDELPMSGRIEGDVWAASYWPTKSGSTNYRWQGSSTLSPMEKYDVAFHDWTPSEEYADSVPSDCGEEAHEKYTAYRQTLGPAARWQAGAQGRDRMFDGVDNDDDGDADECGSDTDGIEGWWGLCHAWSPAAILEPEPLHAVEYNGQRFEVSDIKALILTVYDGTESLFLGGRCNAKEFERDDNHRITQDECRDVNPGAWHVVVTNLIGINHQGFVEDRTIGFQVWNQPLVAYDISLMEEVSLEKANELLGVEGDAYLFNDEAKRFYEVRMTTDYLVEGSQSTQPLGSDGYIRHDSYHYLLEIGDGGKILGGEWLDSSRDAHPDFLWVPLRPRTGWGRRSNPNVDYDQVKMLLELSRRDVDPVDPVDPSDPVEGTTYTNETEMEIPDDDATGIASVIEVTDDFAVGTISVTVDVQHTYVGDLVIELEHDNVRATLRDRDGGSADDLLETYSVDDFAGASSRGEWTLRVTDNAGRDVGKLRRFSLTFLSAS